MGGVGGLTCGGGATRCNKRWRRLRIAAQWIVLQLYRRDPRFLAFGIQGKRGLKVFQCLVFPSESDESFSAASREVRSNPGGLCPSEGKGGGATEWVEEADGVLRGEAEGKTKG